MGLNQFQKTLDENIEGQFEVDHGTVTTVVNVKAIDKELIQVIIDRKDNMGEIEFNSHKMYFTARELEDFGHFLSKQGRSMSIKEREGFMESIWQEIEENKSLQLSLENVADLDDDHVDMTRPNLFRDIIDHTTIKNKMRASKDYCRRFYATLCNNGLGKGAATTSYSWRSTGGLVADVLGEGDYLDWYCSGGEGNVDEEVAEDLKEIGWTVLDDYYAEDLSEFKQMKLDGEDDEQK